MSAVACRERDQMMRRRGKWRVNRHSLLIKLCCCTTHPLNLHDSPLNLHDSGIAQEAGEQHTNSEARTVHLTAVVQL